MLGLWICCVQIIIIAVIASAVGIIAGVSMLTSKVNRPANIALVNNATDLWDSEGKQQFMDKMNDHSVFVAYLDGSLSKQYSNQLSFQDTTLSWSDLASDSDIVPLEQLDSCQYSTSISLNKLETSLTSELSLGIKINNSLVEEESRFSTGIVRFDRNRQKHSSSSEDYYYTYEACRLESVVLGINKDHKIESEALTVRFKKYEKNCFTISQSEYNMKRLDGPVSIFNVKIVVKSENDPEMIIAELSNYENSPSLGISKGSLIATGSSLLVFGIISTIITVILIICFPVMIVCTCIITINFYKRYGRRYGNSHSHTGKMVVALNSQSENQMEMQNKGQPHFQQVQPQFQQVPQQQFQQVPQQQFQPQMNQPQFQQVSQQQFQPQMMNQPQKF